MKTIFFFIHIFIQIFMSFKKGNSFLSSKYVTAKLYTAVLLNSIIFFPILMVQMLFPKIQQAPGPIFIILCMIGNF